VASIPFVVGKGTGVASRIGVKVFLALFSAPFNMTASSPILSSNTFSDLQRPKPGQNCPKVASVASRDLQKRRRAGCQHEAGAHSAEFTRPETEV